MTASFCTLTWAPVWVYWARLQVQEAPVSTFPALSRGALKGPNEPLGHLRTARADLV